jgi:hypothetical protein
MGTSVAQRHKAIAAKINTAHRAAYGNAKKPMEHAAECGRLLLKAKNELVEHGGWLPWLEENTEISERQCQRYMRLAQNWAEIESKNDVTSYLGIDDALKLIAKPRTKPAAPEPETEAERNARIEGLLSENPGYHLDKVHDEGAVTIAPDDGEAPKPKLVLQYPEPEVTRVFVIEPDDNAEQPRHIAGFQAALDHARNGYAAAVRLFLDLDLDAEEKAVVGFLREIGRERQARRASTLPQAGRSEVRADDITSETSDDFPEIPTELDRRRSLGGPRYGEV